jgi:hypothetical protein
MRRWGSVDRLLGGRRFLHYRKPEETFFLEAMQESFAYQFLHDPTVEQLCEQHGFFPHQLKRPEDLHRLPLQSDSGAFDPRTRRRLVLAAVRTFGNLGLANRRHTHHLWLGDGWDPLTRQALESVTRSGESLDVDRASLPGTLERLAGSSVRLICSSLEGLSLTGLGPNSLAITTDLTSGSVGVPVRRFLRPSSHPVWLGQCPHGGFHLSRLVRVLTDSEGGQSWLCPIGRGGLGVRVAIPAPLIWQLNCPCGRNSPFAGNQVL